MRERGPAGRWRPEGSPWSMRRFRVGGITGSGSFPRSRRGVAGPLRKRPGTPISAATPS
ncbi:hypothetical protein REMIM1_CH01195 [Rhizobium etli bv. mimosae str. Mim1]|nr:hypothetical protein REMIM1_CH01195 [Rhizobium etli bv. mimosae str. Mim1]